MASSSTDKSVDDGAGAMTDAVVETKFGDEPPSPVGATYVAESTEHPLKPGEKIDHLFRRNETQPYVLQRLTDRTYWFERQHYATTFYVGDDGVLLFDPLAERTENILEAIGRVTELPVRTIVYSHDHYDHIGEADIVLRAMNSRGVTPEIVASAATAAKQEWRKSALPRATRVLQWPQDRFEFEDLHVELHGFERAAHCDDHAAFLLAEERVLHAADHSNPDQPPFWKFSANENFLYFEHNLRETERLDWLYENGGHGNVGSKDEREFYYRYIADMTDAVRHAMEVTDFREAGKDIERVNCHTVWHVGWTDLVARRAIDALRPKYGQYYGFEYGAWSNAEQVVWALFAYRK